MLIHDDLIKWNHFPRYWPFVRGIHRSPVNSLHRGQWRGDLMFPLICALNKRINGWVNNREAGDSRRHRTHYDAIVMLSKLHLREVLITIPCCEFPRSQDITKISVYSLHRNPLSRMFTNLIFWYTGAIVICYTTNWNCYMLLTNMHYLYLIDDRALYYYSEMALSQAFGQWEHSFR